jgi:hypothetical protein
MSENKANIRIVNLATYTSPAIIERANKEWVEYGEDNDYFQWLIDLYYASPTNNACIKGKSDLVFGHGPEVVKADRHLKGYLDFKILFQDDECRKVIMDLCLLGMGAFQIVKSKDGKKYLKSYHFPMQTLRPEKANDDGDIEAWYYCPDWSKLKRGQKPKRFSAFGFEGKESECILVIKPYATGSHYFSPPDWQGGAQYAELESEISNYHINGIKNGLAPSMLINFNNGEPPEETKTAIEGKINQKFSGSSNVGRSIISFNESKEFAADITPVVLSDLPAQYEFLSTECTDKVLLAHRITSPLIFGVKNSGNGFSSNAEELKTAMILFDNIVIRPIQKLVIDAFNKVLLANEVMLDIYFKTLQPLEFNDLSNRALTPEQREKEMALSAEVDMTEEDERIWMERLSGKGEVIDSDEWDIIDEREATEEDDKLELAFEKPDLKSKDDKGIFKIRYRYGPAAVQPNSREFCKFMVALTKKNVVYRREDINEMSFSGVNGQFAQSGKSNYSIWKFKGGVNCHHAWSRVTYMRKTENGFFKPLTTAEKGTNVREMENYDKVSNAKANAEGVPFNPPSWDTAQTKPINMPNKGGLK